MNFNPKLLPGKVAPRDSSGVDGLRSKEIRCSNDEMRIKMNIPTQSSSQRKKSVISTYTQDESRKRSEEQKQKRQHIREWIHVEGLKNGEVPQAKPDTKAKSIVSNDPKNANNLGAIVTTMLGKSIRSDMPAADNVETKILPSKSNVEVSGIKSMTDYESSKGQDTRTNNNLSKANDNKERINAKPIFQVAKKNNNGGSNDETTGTGQVFREFGSTGKADNKMRYNPCKETTTETETKPANVSSLARRCGNFELMSSIESARKIVKLDGSERCATIKSNNGMANTGGKFANVKNSTRTTMIPIEKKKDGTLIDYGLMVTTSKKPERKLSDYRGNTGLERKKISKQEHSVIVASITEVIPKKNTKAHGDPINRNIKAQECKLNGIYRLLFSNYITGKKGIWIIKGDI